MRRRARRASRASVLEPARRPGRGWPGDARGRPQRWRGPTRPRRSQPWLRRLPHDLDGEPPIRLDAAFAVSTSSALAGCTCRPSPPFCWRAGWLSQARTSRLRATRSGSRDRAPPSLAAARRRERRAGGACGDDDRGQGRQSGAGRGAAPRYPRRDPSRDARGADAGPHGRLRGRHAREKRPPPACSPTPWSRRDARRPF